MPFPAFLSPLPLTLHHIRHAISSRRPVRNAHRAVMIQTPFGEGPPNLDTFFDPKRKRIDPDAAPVTIGTARANVANYPSIAEAAKAAFAIASESLDKAQLCHVTYSLDVDAKELSAALKEVLDGVPLIGRSVEKKESSGTIELLLMHSAAAGGIQLASASAPMSTDGDVVTSAVAEQAAREALGKLDGVCRFMVFCSTPGGEKSVREGLDRAMGGVVAYGGPAVGDGWSLIDGEGDVCVKVAAVPGSLSFLLSAVIKTWMQPKYTEMMGFMKPTYVGDLKWDLLTAIRYDDWGKFVECLEGGVDVNVRWEEKQNQIPLLAACARGRVDMVRYLLDKGGDVGHRNDGGFTAVMYTRMLVEFNREVVMEILTMLKDKGAELRLKRSEMEMLQRATGGRIVQIDED